MSAERRGPLVSPGYHLWNASLRWTNEVAQALAPFDLTHTQFFVLGALGWLTKTTERAPNQREVAEFAKLDKVMTSQLTRGLEAAGLLVREDDPVDTRSWRLKLTPRGQKLLVEAAAKVRETDTRFFKSLGTELPRFTAELEQLHRDRDRSA